MKKFLTAVLLSVSCLTLAACGKGKGTTTTTTTAAGETSTSTSEVTTTVTPTTTTTTAEPVENPLHTEVTNQLIFHYKRSDNDYSKFNSIWIWPKSGDGDRYYFDGTDSYGTYLFIDLAEFAGTEEFGFLVRDNDWNKDISNDRFVLMNKLKVDEAGNYNVYLKSGDANVYISANSDLISEVTTFAVAYDEADKKYSLNFELTVPYESFEITKNGSNLVTSENVQSDPNAVVEKNLTLAYDLGSEMPSFTDVYTLHVIFKGGVESTTGADTSTLYDTSAFEEAYTYTGELGAIYAAEKTTFRVWSPVSSELKLRIYDNGTPTSLADDEHAGSDAYTEYDMSRGEKGTWEAVIPGDLEGKYYTYVVTNGKYTNKEVVDPYAKSTGINGLRGMIVDFSKTNPEGWDSVNVNEIPSTSLTVYETHIADLTSSDTWGGTAENAKTFMGFCETGTTYTEGAVTVTTGFDHIKDLGVNAVQIIPIFDAANDERIENREFNWGYNPLNYNSLDGIYSKNPYDGYEKIKEFKQLVQAYNNAGINIIMDVVYNHVNGASESNFDVLMPGYYYRYNSDGSLSNGSGCGNETASDRAMFHKFMVDSTKFWASEYKLGGFRFDLMGVHDLDTMSDIADTLHSEVSEYITVYGEPWTGGTIAMDETISAKQANLAKYGDYGCFNDKMRDSLIKGGMNSATAKGWITDNSSVTWADLWTAEKGIRGQILKNVTDPSKCVNYVTCHDNYTLYDRIKAAGITDEETVKKMAMLANSMVFTSQGITFMLSGEEFLRTKNGDSNSYNASYEENALDYSLKVKNIDMFENYQKLIALKQNANLFGLDADAAQAITFTEIKDGAMIYYDLSYTDAETGDTYTYRIIHANGIAASEKYPHTVDLEGYILYLDTTGEIDELTAETFIDVYETVIAYKVTPAAE